jgi:hypothetical protein
LQDPPECAQFSIFGLKINPLATLIETGSSEFRSQAMLSARVTRLGDFSPFGQMFSLGHFLKITDFA